MLPTSASVIGHHQQLLSLTLARATVVCLPALALCRRECALMHRLHQVYTSLPSILRGGQRTSAATSARIKCFRLHGVQAAGVHVTAVPSRNTSTLAGCGTHRVASTLLCRASLPSRWRCLRQQMRLPLAHRCSVPLQPQLPPLAPAAPPARRRSAFERLDTCSGVASCE
jgi:hypothetical protein